MALSKNLATLKLEHEAYRYFSAWQIPIMLSVLDLHRAEKDHRKIAAFFNPPISAIESRRAIKTLVEMGFISWDQEQGQWRINRRFLQSTETARCAALKGFHEAVQQMGLDAYKNDFDGQTFSTLTLSMSRQTRDEVEKIIADARSAIMEKVKADSRPEVAVQVNFQIFNVSKDAPRPVQDPGKGAA